ncbi:MAG: PaaI family thioesterase [Bacteroidales bacterium]|nr:PaaI family thioesterase [Bacteroidales bacterium]
MKKIKNPFVESENYNCFGCSPHHPFGLKMKFFEEGDEIVAFWEPDNLYQGWNNILHGGIQATLMDEIGSWAVFVKLKTSGVTTKMEVRLKKPVYTNKGKLTLKASIGGVNKKIAEVNVYLFDSENILCAESKIFYYIYTQNVAREKSMYPGIEKFYE